LRALASVTPKLQQNCRNTPQVVAAVELCSGAPIGHALVKGAGPAVEYLDVRAASAVPALAATQVRKWMEAGVDLREILLLLGRDESGAAAAEVGRVAGVQILPWEDARHVAAKALG